MRTSELTSPRDGIGIGGSRRATIRTPYMHVCEYVHVCVRRDAGRGARTAFRMHAKWTERRDATLRMTAEPQPHSQSQQQQPQRRLTADGGAGKQRQRTVRSALARIRLMNAKWNRQEIRLNICEHKGGTRIPFAVECEVFTR